jgi:hypothetical protein
MIAIPAIIPARGVFSAGHASRHPYESSCSVMGTQSRLSVAGAAALRRSLGIGSKWSFCSRMLLLA